MEFVLQQIRGQRLMRNVTLSQLSQWTGISESYLAEMEHNRVDPPLSCLVKITSALNVTVNIGDVSI